MKKQLVLMILTAVLMFSLAGCGKKQQSLAVKSDNLETTAEQRVNLETDTDEEAESEGIYDQDSENDIDASENQEKTAIVDVPIDIAWEEHDFVVTDHNGYKLLVKLKLTPLCSVSSDMEYIKSAWAEVAPDKNLPTDIDDWGFDKSSTNDMFYSVGRISIINKTEGWDITSSSQVRFDFKMVGINWANYKVFFDKIISEQGILDFAVSLDQNRSGVPIIICHPETYMPNYPEGRVRDYWESVSQEKDQFDLNLQWADVGGFSIPYLEY